MANAVTLPAIDCGVREVVFKFDGQRPPQARSVSLVGSFNRWDTSVHRMTRHPNGSWTISVTLAPGKHSYLFIVDGVPWNDLADDGRAPCEWGGEYSVRVVR